MTCVSLTLQVVEVGVLCHSAVKEGPGEVVHCVLLVLYCLCHHLRIEVVVHEVVQLGLHWGEGEGEGGSEGGRGRERGRGREGGQCGNTEHLYTF